MKRSGYQMIWYFLKPYPKALGWILATTILASVLEVLYVAAFFPVFQSVLGTAVAANQTGMLRGLAMTAAWLPITDPILSAAVMLLMVTLVRAAVVLARESLVAQASGTIQHDVKIKLLAAYASAPFTFFLERRQGRLQYTVMVAAQRVGLLVRRVPQAAADVLKVAVLSLMLLTMTPWVMAGLAAVGAAYHWLSQRVARQVSYRTGRGRALAGTEQIAIAGELLTGIRQLTVFGATASWVERFVRQSWTQRGYFVKDAIWFVVPRHLMECTFVLLLVVFLAAGRMLDPAGLSASLPLVGVLVVALVQVMPALSNVSTARMEISGLLADAEIVYDELAQALPAAPRDGTQPSTGLRAAVVFDHVTFGYAGRPPVFEGLDLTIAHGRITALVGSSGSGKTTLVNLLLRLLQPGGGRVLIDGVDLQDLEVGTWRQRIGFVSQDPFIVHGSVRENILFGRSGYTHEAVERAARVANAHPFIAELPQGYETVVGERGMKLSGGQQQRLAIARAVLADPELFIFDEATSSLDSVSEQLVQQAIETIAKDRTVLVIAHRLSTVRRADTILVLEQGRIVEQGTHDALLRNQGRYAQLVGASA